MVNIVVGCQWGDEGKGKVVDMLSRGHDVIARYQGGANAGHTVEIGEKKYVLHLIPSGILWEHTECVIGNGVVLDPAALLEELALLEKSDISTKGRLFVSENCHIIMPYHKLIDKLGEEKTLKIGTTGRGIGPCYVDKAARRGVRFQDLFNPATLRELVGRNFDEKYEVLGMELADLTSECDRIVSQYLSIAQSLESYLADTVAILNSRRIAGKRILLEGAQGTLLDVDHGTYPFVTSSHPTTGGAFTGTGLPPNSVSEITGVLKAYTTRVGEGPFPTELNDATGERLRSIGNEFGATTGRPRRCGWFDIPLAGFSIMVNGITGIALTKLDVLDSFESIRVCTGYRRGGESVPFSNTYLSEVEPVYEELKGWKASTVDCREYGELPAEARTYIEFLEKKLNCPVKFVSTGAKRDEIIRR